MACLLEMNPSETRSAYSIDPSTRISRVSLVVANLQRSVRFYVESLGFRLASEDRGYATLRVPGSQDTVIELFEEYGTTPRPPRTMGLYHFAILVPTRRDLARSLKRYVEKGNRIQGASDHVVSEALYMADPDGNGVEIYRDRPAGGWVWTNGEVGVETLPMSFHDLLGELDGDTVPWDGIAAGARIGHMHLHVPDLREAQRFYVDVMGFKVTSRVPGAVFVSAGNYHHHIGLNTWAGRQPAPKRAAGLERFEIQLPSAQALGILANRLNHEGPGLDPSYDGIMVRDPFGNKIVLSTPVVYSESGLRTT